MRKPYMIKLKENGNQDEQIKHCIICGKEIPKNWRSYRSKVCSEDCRKISLKDKGLLPTATVGALSELTASVDLMKKGYHVFRALSPSCPHDLVIIKDDKTITIQVRTASILPSGIIFCNKSNMTSDILAMVIGTENIQYEPSLESFQ